MKVFLIKDVSGVGQNGHIVEVKEGYAHNFLIPNHLAKFADEKLIFESEKISRRKIIMSTSFTNDVKANIRSLQGKSISVVGKANEKGHLFAQIHEDEIISAISKQHSIKLPKDILTLKNPIKEIGTHQLKLKRENVEVKMKVEVKAT